MTRFARSAPTIPGVVAAIRPRSTSSASGTDRVCTSRIFCRPARSGGCTATRRSKRPGRSSALSSTSGRFVAAITITPVDESKPSISVRIWFSVCSRSSLPPLKPATPALRERPIASSSSMKTIAGAASFACLNRSRTRDAPIPTIASTNSDADIEKNGAPASPATARASSVFPVPGGPLSSTPCGIAPAEPLVLLGVAQEVDDLGQLRLRLVDPGDVGERDRDRRTARSAAPASGRTRRASPARCRPAASARRAARSKQDRRPEAEQQRSPTTARCRAAASR